MGKKHKKKKEKQQRQLAKAFIVGGAIGAALAILGNVIIGRRPR
jgi:hypothetical protein